MINKNSQSSLIELEVQSGSQEKSQSWSPNGKKESSELDKEKIRERFMNPVLPDMDSIGSDLPFGISYTTKQKNSIIDGFKKRKGLLTSSFEAARRALEYDEIMGDFRVDTLLMGSTGIGKSYNTLKALEMMNVNAVVIQGNTTPFQFGIKLLMNHYRFMLTRKSESERMVVVMDDCDSFFANMETLNILKGMTGKRGTRCYQYNKALLLHLLTEDQIAIVSLPTYSHSDGSSGFRVNCDDIIFIVNTNFKLPTENQANAYGRENPGTPRANRLNDLAAIRRRFNTEDFMLEKYENWGWLAYVSLYDGLLDDLGETQEAVFRKHKILDFIYQNWDTMTEHNLDTVTDMLLKMKKYPSSYTEIWETKLIEK
jgi:hypothetical protein